MRKLGFTDKYVNSSRQHILNFTLLKNSWFYNPTQRFIKYKMPLVSSSTCYSKLLAIKTFYEFIIKNFYESKFSSMQMNLKFLVSNKMSRNG